MQKMWLYKYKVEVHFGSVWLTDGASRSGEASTWPALCIPFAGTSLVVLHGPFPL